MKPKLSILVRRSLLEKKTFGSLGLVWAEVLGSKIKVQSSGLMRSFPYSHLYCRVIHKWLRNFFDVAILRRLTALIVSKFHPFTWVWSNKSAPNKSSSGRECFHTLLIETD